MTETQFIEKNKDQWIELEKLLQRSEKDPDRLHSLFVKVSSDLAYASTFYPKRSVRAYLNQLTQQVFASMEEKKSEWNMQPIHAFFSDILPSEMYKSRKALLTSFIIFIIALIIGIVSSANNPDFVKVILGDQYVSMTEDNINQGDPMAVYKGEDQANMFFGITINNIRVSFLCFILGIFGSLGTIIVLFYNGIMVGAFQYFFYAKGLFLESFLTIWIHGTIEISAIIIAGSAGIVLGNGLLFPKTFDRGTSMQMAAKRAVRILVGTLPLFVIAGFLESFITRLTGMPEFLKWTIIILSFCLILGMYVIFPWWHHRNSSFKSSAAEIKPDETQNLVFDKHRLRSFNENMYLSFAQFRSKMGSYTSHALSVVMMFFIGSLILYQTFLSPHAFFEKDTVLIADIDFGGIFMFVIYWLGCSFLILVLVMIYRGEVLTFYNKMVHLKLFFINFLLVSLIPVMLFYLLSVPWMILLFIIIPPQFLAYTFYMIPEKNWTIWRELGDYYNLALSSWFSYILIFTMIAFFHLILGILSGTQIGGLFFDFFSWHDIFSGANVTHVFIMTTAYFLIFVFILPLYFYAMINMANSEAAKRSASDLWNRFKFFNNRSEILETYP